jgi:hypothetical protein
MALVKGTSQVYPCCTLCRLLDGDLIKVVVLGRAFELFSYLKK